MNKTKSFIRWILRQTAAVAAVAAVLGFAAAPAFAQSAEVRYAGVFYKNGADGDTVENMYCDWDATAIDASSGAASASQRSFVYNVRPGSSQHDVDPWVSSALIEYDQPYPNDTPSENHYPNHCLALCMNVYCQNRPLAASTYSITFPLNELHFDIVKYYNQKNIASAEEAPAQRTINLYPATDSNNAKCGSYVCGYGGDAATCPNPKYEYDGTQGNPGYGKYRILSDPNSDWKDCTSKKCSDEFTCEKGTCDFVTFNNDGVESGKPITFCAAWDGSYDIAGEFGKTNGQFGFRATAATNAPGDGVTVDKIEFNSTIAYPGMNQIPIQVDVTNIHTVRSTPSLVGKITAVSAQPYTYAYRLSKDADVRIAIFDASTDDATAYASSSVDDIARKDVVRMLVDWQPRMGEGMKGVEKDVQIGEFDSWDGRNDDGMLLPAGNYVVSLQAKSQDEWPGVDFSRAVTRQLSLDPLKLTDIQSVGLNKKATAYASIQYQPTESAKVYWEIYTPGTVFESVLTNSAAETGTPPTIKGNTGTLVYRAIENRTGRADWTSKWDGLCGNVDTNGNPASCKRTYAKGEKKSDGTTCTDNTCEEEFAPGAPMPDGNYVYALWAEIPYNGCYYNKASGRTDAPKFVAVSACTENTTNTQAFTGVKTLKYNTGIISVDRGVVDVTIQPVSYDTVGSSPTAYGLNPFIFKYSIARDATVIAKVENTAGVVVKYLTPQDGITQVAQQMNTLSWDGRDDSGRMVYPGTYMFVVETKDGMFPSVTNRAAAVFPVDMYRVVDLATTDVYGDSTARATISYALSRSMNVQTNIYNKDVVIPDYNTLSGGIGGTVTADVSGTISDSGEGKAEVQVKLPGATTTTTVKNQHALNFPGVTVEEQTIDGKKYTVTWTAIQQGSSSDYYVSASITSAIAWPPRVCDKDTDSGVFYTSSIGDTIKKGAVNPATQPKCIYVNDTTFTQYPADAEHGNYDNDDLNVRLKPIKTFDDRTAKPGDGITITEEWDALYFRNPKNCGESTTDLSQCSYEMVPDGQYPFFIMAKSNEPFSRYYADGETGYLIGAPFKTSAEIKQENYLYATEKPVSKINITRGAVFFLDGTTVVYPNAPQLFNVSTGPIFVPPYEINFSVSRASTVEVAIVALKDNVCVPQRNAESDEKNNKAGDVCKYLSTMTIVNTSNFDPDIVRKIYWDGTDNNGFYVKPAIYEVRLTARNYPDANLYEPTVKSIALNADLLKVFDLYENDGYAISVRGQDMKIPYQVSVPMKVAIQILKPGTTIYDYSKGTLRNPTTGQEVKDIREVLVRAIVGIRPATTLIEELWDGTDYAGQEVPDGTYPFRFVTVTADHSADIDTVTGEIIGTWGETDGTTDPTKWKINQVADTYEYQNLHKATVAVGDGRFVCSDWEKTVFFYPNPLRNADRGTLEITKMPVPGEVSIKFFNLAGDLVRDSGYTCVDANNYQTTMGNSLSFNPDNNPIGSTKMNEDDLNLFPSQRNAALRCRWDRTNQHGKKVARGVYFGLVDFKAKNGREHCQKVVKVLVP